MESTEIKDFILHQFRTLDFGCEDYEKMDNIIFITQSQEGYDISHLKFSHSEDYQLEILHNIDTKDLNDYIKLCELIFDEKSEIIAKGKMYEDELDYPTMTTGVFITRFKNSNNWIELFIEEGELEIAFHFNMDTCICHGFQFLSINANCWG